MDYSLKNRQANLNPDKFKHTTPPVYLDTTSLTDNVKLLLSGKKEAESNQDWVDYVTSETLEKVCICVYNKQKEQEVLELIKEKRRKKEGKKWGWALKLNGANLRRMWMTGDCINRRQGCHLSVSKILQVSHRTWGNFCNSLLILPFFPSRRCLHINVTSIFKPLCAFSFVSLLPQSKQIQEKGWLYSFDEFDRFPGPPPSQPAPTDSNADPLVIITHPRFFKLSHIPLKWLQLFYVFSLFFFHTTDQHVHYPHVCLPLSMHMWWIECALFCFCIVYRIVAKAGRQLGRLWRKWGAIKRKKGQESQKEWREWTIQLLSTVAKHFGKQAVKSMALKRQDISSF